MVNSKKRKREDPPAGGATNIITADGVHITPRKNHFSSETWWEVDIMEIGSNDDSSSSCRQGATALVKRCMRNCGWNLDKTKDILEAYRQFLTLKKEHEDWDATILSPSHLVDEMWHQHILDIGNYCHDMMLLCGRVVLHNPDGALDKEAKKRRDTKTRSELVKRFGLYDVNVDVWEVSFGEFQTLDTAADDGNFMIYVGMQNKMYQFAIFSRGAKMVELFTEFEKVSGLNRSHIRFLLNGRRIREDQTAEELGLEDGAENQIEAVKSEKAVSGPIIIKFIDQLDHEIHFKVASTFRLKKAFKVYAKRRNLRSEQLRFLHCGVLLQDDDTPERHDMEDGSSQIDVEINRGGC